MATRYDLAVANAVIRLSRAQEGWRDSLRSYRVRLDGVRVGKISRGKTLEFSVEPGVHRLQLTIDWASSRLYAFRLTDDQTAEFSCKPHGAYYEVWRSFITVGEYIELVPLSPITPA